MSQRWELPELSEDQIRSRLGGLEISFGRHVETAEERVKKLRIEKGTHFIKLSRSLNLSTLYVGDYKGLDGKNIVSPDGEELHLREAVIRADCNTSHFVYDPESWDFTENSGPVDMTINPLTDEPELIRSPFMRAVLTTEGKSNYSLWRETGVWHEEDVMAQARTIRIMSIPETAALFVLQTTPFTEDVDIRTAPSMTRKVHY